MNESDYLRCRSSRLQIARHLASEKNDVTIVDSDQDLVERGQIL